MSSVCLHAASPMASVLRGSISCFIEMGIGNAGGPSGSFSRSTRGCRELQVPKKHPRTKDPMPRTEQEGDGADRASTG